jgi:UDP-glucose 4-epimerase
VPGALTGKVVAVTGAAGFIGARLVSRLAGEACTVMPIVRPDDVTERAVWDRIVDADVIIHLAAQTSVAVANDDPGRDFQANVMPMRHLIAACRDRRRTPIVVFAGTVTQAGVPSRLPVNEDAPDDPLTTYDLHKLMAEHELKAAASNGQLRGATLRLANVYGPGAHGRRADRHILNRMIDAAVNGRPLTVHGSGENVRDYVFVDDVVDAFMAAAAHGDRCNGGHFVIGSGRGTSIREAFELIAERVARSTGRRVPVTTIEPPGPASEIERRDFVADHERFSRATGWHPQTSLSEGIDRTIEALQCA